MNAYLSTLSEHEVRIPCPGAVLHGDVSIPAGATGLVIFAHGSGSSRDESAQPVGRRGNTTTRATCDPAFSIF